MKQREQGFSVNVRCVHRILSATAVLHLQEKDSDQPEKNFEKEKKGINFSTARNGFYCEGLMKKAGAKNT